MRTENIIYHIVSFLFGVLLSYALIFNLSPSLFRMAKKSDEKIKTVKEIDSILIDYYNDDTKSHLWLFLKTPKKKFKAIYYTPNHEEEQLVAFLKKKQFIGNKPIENSVPIILSKKDISAFSKIQLESKGNTIKKLVIDNYYVVGKPNSFLKKHLLYLFSAITLIMGVLLFILMFLVLITYIKTGELPKETNKLEGIKKFFYLFRKK